jgi:hypothetical protein
MSRSQLSMGGCYGLLETAQDEGGNCRMNVEPETQYAKTEEGYVGYQVFGQGPF